MASIIVYDSSCQIVEEDDVDFLKKLDRHLSFFIQGAEHSKAFKGYINARGEEVTWDGHRHLMSSSLRFPYGLLPRVIRFFEKNDKVVNIIDRKTPKTIGCPIDIIPKLALSGITPYPYQIESVKIAKGKDRGIIRIGTGGGKSILAALLIAELGKSAIIYVIGIDLLYQMHELFTSLFDQPIGIIGDGKCEIHNINIATVWSVGQVLGLKKKITLDDEDGAEKKIDPAKFRQIKSMLLNTGVHLIDECQMAACDTVQVIARNIKPEYIFGMSASPWRDDNADLLIEAVLGEKIVDIGAKWLIDNGYLVRPDIRFLAPDSWGKSKKPYQTIYHQYVVMNEQRNGMILKAAKKMVEAGYVVLVLFRSLAHGKILYDLISKEIPCAMLSGKDSSKKRLQVKADVENGKISLVISSSIYDQGLNLPILSGLIIASSGKSSVRALQRIGRSIRLYKNKKRAVIIDFADQAPYLFDHALARKKIYETEFEVSWPEKNIK